MGRVRGGLALPHTYWLQLRKKQNQREPSILDTHQRQHICRSPASLTGEAGAHPGRTERSLEAEEKEDLEEPTPNSGPGTSITEEEKVEAIE